MAQLAMIASEMGTFAGDMVRKLRYICFRWYGPVIFGDGNSLAMISLKVRNISKVKRNSDDLIAK